jgi:hypothetical protein
MKNEKGDESLGRQCGDRNPSMAADDGSLTEN